MNTDFQASPAGDEYELLQKELIRLLSRELPPHRSRDLIEAGRVRAALAPLAAHGFFGLLAPSEEACGGGSLSGLAGTISATGASVLHGAFFTSAIAVPTLLAAAPPTPFGAGLLEQIVDGSRLATLAWPIDPGAEGMRLGDDGGEYRLEGVLENVPCAGDVDDVLAVVGSGGAARLVAIPTELEGVECRIVDGIDPGMASFRVSLTGARLDPGRVWTLEQSRDLGTVAAAIRVGHALQMLGAGRVAMQGAVEHVSVRHQFGKPLGSFQAVKHRLAAVLIAIESAQSAVHYAAWAVDTGRGDQRSAALLAHYAAGQAFMEAAEAYVHLLGAVGMTWEHQAHLYLRRAHADLRIWGDDRAGLADGTDEILGVSR